MRFLSCMCDQCKGKDWDRCTNRGYVGSWKRVEIEKVGDKGVRVHTAERKAMAQKIGKTVKKGDNVAVLTHADDRCHRFWLAKVVKAPYTLKDKDTCQVSGVEFDAKERVLEVNYYERVGRESTAFTLDEDLGLFLIPESMLRAGGTTLPINLARRAATRRHTGALDLPENLNKRILHLIDQVYKDKEYGE